MKTPTHMLIGHLVGRLLPGSGKGKSGWVIAGAAAPDLPLIAVAIFCVMELAAAEVLGAQTVRFIDLVDGFYYDNSVFIVFITYCIHRHPWPCWSARGFSWAGPENAWTCEVSGFSPARLRTHLSTSSPMRATGYWYSGRGTGAIDLTPGSTSGTWPVPALSCF